MKRTSHKLSRIVYLAAIGVMLIFFFLTLSKYKAGYSAVHNGRHLVVNITRVSCSGSKYGRSYFAFIIENQQKTINVSYYVCTTLNTGDPIEVLYSPEYDDYYPWYINPDDEIPALLFIGSAIVVMPGWLLFRTKRRKHKAGL